MSGAASQNRILIVDDEPAIRDSLSIVFEDDGWQVSVAEDARAALAMWEPGSFDLIIVDKNMPEMTGIELVAEVRPRDLDVAFFVLTGFASEKSALKSLNLGIDAYATKPVRDVYRLSGRCRQLLARRKKRRELETTRPVVSGADKVGTLVWCQPSRRGLLESSLTPVLGALDFTETAPGVIATYGSGEHRLVVIDHEPGEPVSVGPVAALAEELPGLFWLVVSDTLSLQVLMELTDIQGVSVIDDSLDSPAAQRQLGEVVTRIERASGQ